MKTSAFTLKSDTILNILRTDIFITSEARDTSKLIDSKIIWNGLWDTGASQSAIDFRVVKELSLVPIGEATISTANGLVTVNTYIIDVTIPNNVTIKDIVVNGATLGEDADMLIGMDIIRFGDFSITNM